MTVSSFLLVLYAELSSANWLLLGSTYLPFSCESDIKLLIELEARKKRYAFPKIPFQTL